MKSAWAGAAALALLLPAANAGAGDLLDLLRPGSRPAAGLAGDPFRSLFDPASSVWGERALASPAGAWIEAESAQPLDGAHVPVELHGSRVSWTAGAPVRVGRTTWGVAGRLSRPAWSAGWGGAASGVTTGGGAPQLDVAVRPPLPIPGAALDVTLPVWSDPDRGARTIAGVSLRWVGVPWLGLAGRTTATRVPDAIRSTLGGEALQTSLNLSSRRYEGEARVALLPAVIAEAWASNATFSPLSARDAAPVYHLDPGGTARSTGVGVIWGRAGGPRLLARSAHAGTECDADLSWGGERFGNLNYARVDAHSWLVGAEWPSRDGRGRWLADFESARATAQARADVESWPFTSSLVDMLGPRRIYRAGADLRWEAWHVATERSAGRFARVRAGAGWYDLRPQGSIESWRPAFLVFGRVDDAFAGLDVSRVQVAELALGGHVRVGGFDLGCDVRQIVWGRASRSRTPALSGEAPPNVSPSATDVPTVDPSVFPAGGRATVTVARFF